MFVVIENSFDLFVAETTDFFGEVFGMWMYTDWRTGPRRFVLILGLFEVLCVAWRHEEAG